jgi:hypothetical protein
MNVCTGKAILNGFSKKAGDTALQDSPFGFAVFPRKQRDKNPV